jgi:hypothetical protein
MDGSAVGVRRAASQRWAQRPRPARVQPARACRQGARACGAQLARLPSVAEEEEDGQCSLCCGAPIDRRLTACGHGACATCIDQLMARARTTVRHTHQPPRAPSAASGAQQTRFSQGPEWRGARAA